ncbi:MAG: YcjF family protein [Gammaproteobacteria bacterium]
MAEAKNKVNESAVDDANSTEPENRTERAGRFVRNYALGSIVIGVIPLPLVDLVALTGLQLKMLHSLSKIYEVEFSEQLGKSLIASLLGGGLSLSVSANLASLARSLAKSVPVYGTATGMASVAVFGSASTYGIGKVFIQHFESGGTLLDFDPERVRNYYAEQFEIGKKELKKGAVGKKP